MYGFTNVKETAHIYEHCQILRKDLAYRGLIQKLLTLLPKKYVEILTYNIFDKLFRAEQGKYN